MFNVGVMLGRIGYYVVNIVVSLPPTYAQSAEKVSNHDSDYRIDVEIMRDAHVTGIVGGEDQLVPEHAKAQCTHTEPAMLQGQDERAEEERVSEGLDGIGFVAAIEKPFSLHFDL